MANGKPGDHPLTDILLHGGSEFGEPVDSFVRDLAATASFERARDEVADLLLELSPMYRSGERDRLAEEAFRRLASIRMRLESAP